MSLCDVLISPYLSNSTGKSLLVLVRACSQQHMAAVCRAIVVKYFKVSLIYTRSVELVACST